jgi:hypothetical protein
VVAVFAEYSILCEGIGCIADLRRRVKDIVYGTDAIIDDARVRFITLFVRGVFAAFIPLVVFSMTVPTIPVTSAGGYPAIATGLLIILKDAGLIKFDPVIARDQAAPPGDLRAVGAPTAILRRALQLRRPCRFPAANAAAPSAGIGSRKRGL